MAKTLTKAQRRAKARPLAEMHKALFRIRWGTRNSYAGSLEELKRMLPNAPEGVDIEAAQKRCINLSAAVLDLLSETAEAYADLMDGQDPPHVVAQARERYRNAGQEWRPENALHFKYEMQDGVAVKKA